ncbi:uncharacterized protein LOC134712574 isoform X2 [Mytilus trossulus]|uniref:uncharacterized protein LOC134712574 isoform X2 n=1 Tax=Mytilus trossulus TaxID=6551 RepID=UPI0030042424
MFCFNIALFVIHYAVAIQKFSRCPSAVSRGLIAQETCPRAPKHYHCLENLQSEDFLQICIRPERIEEGEYPVFQDSTAKYIFPKTCVSSRYQPRPMFTYERNECWYEKSSCTEEGQIIFSNGSATNDRTCRCDYTKGYAFISTPINTCYCVPSKENCSCYKKECLNKKEVLNADYVCSTVKDNETCPVIVRTDHPDIPEKKINKTVINTVLYSNQVKLLRQSATIKYIIILVILLSTIIIIYYLLQYDKRISNSMFSCLNQQCSEESSKPESVPSTEKKNEDIGEIVDLQRKKEHIELRITEELKNIMFKESNSVLFECTVSKKNSLATWLKDGKQIQTRRYICQSEENSHSLKIEKASLQDIGTYTVIIEDKLSFAMLSKEEDVEHLSDVKVTMEDTKPSSNKQDDGEHLSAAKKVIMGNTKPLPNEQQEKTEITDTNTCASKNNTFDSAEEIGTSQKESLSLKKADKEIYDAVIVCETEDEREAEEFFQHIKALDKEWQLDIKIGFSQEMLFKGSKISSDEKLFDVARYILIFFTKRSTEMIQRFKNEGLLVNSLSDTDKMFRVIPVSVDGPECIPYEFGSLIPINYYNYKMTRNRGLEDKVYIKMLQRLFQTGRKEHLPY